MQHGNLFNYQKFPLGSSLTSLEFPIVFESNPQAKAFKKFVEQLDNSKNQLKIQYQQEILTQIKVKVPELKNIQELKNCYAKAFLKTKKNRRKNYDFKNEKWRFQTIILFVWTITEYSFLNQIQTESFTEEDWKFIATLFPHVTPQQCQYKWEAMQKSTAQKNEWSNEEDLILIKLVKECQDVFKNQQSFKWAKIARDLNAQKYSNDCVRLGKHCRERWMNCLNPELSKKEWTLEEEMILLDQIVKNGRKWSVISKTLPGRNEHTVKNRFVSILRFLKKKGKFINPNNFQDVLDTYKRLKESNSPKKKNKPFPHKIKPLNHMLQVPDEIEEFELSPKKEEFLEPLLVSPNLTEIMEISPAKSRERSWVFNFGTKEPISQSKQIYKVSKFQNMANNYPNALEEEFSTSNNLDNCKNSFEIENISQRMSSMSLSDQIIMEANRILSDISVHSKYMNLFSNSNSGEKSIILANRNSFSTEKSIFYLKARNDPKLLEENSQTNFFLQKPCELNMIYDCDWDNQSSERGARSRCKTQKTDAVDIQERIINPMINLLRKRKSLTFSEQTDSLI